MWLAYEPVHLNVRVEITIWSYVEVREPRSKFEFLLSIKLRRCYCITLFWQWFWKIRFKALWLYGHLLFVTFNRRSYTGRHVISTRWYHQIHRKLLKISQINICKLCWKTNLNDWCTYKVSKGRSDMLWWYAKTCKEVQNI